MSAQILPSEHRVYVRDLEMIAPYLNPCDCGAPVTDIRLEFDSFTGPPGPSLARDTSAAVSLVCGQCSFSSGHARHSVEDAVFDWEITLRNNHQRQLLLNSIDYKNPFFP